MDANHISKVLKQHLWQSYAYVMPNIYLGRYECDMVYLNRKTNFFTEYEIKVTKNDFKQDFKKGFRKFELFNQAGERQHHFVGKHEYFASRQINKWTPNRFVFVVPSGMVMPNEIPEYAGLIYIDKETVSHIKSGKLIHKNPAHRDVVDSILEKAYFRFHYAEYELRRLRTKPYVKPKPLSTPEIIEWTSLDKKDPEHGQYCKIKIDGQELDGVYCSFEMSHGLYTHGFMTEQGETSMVLEEGSKTIWVAQEGVPKNERLLDFYNDMQD